MKDAAGQQVITGGKFGFVQSADTPQAIVPPSQGIQVTMPTSISQKCTSGHGIGEVKENECAVQWPENRAPAARGTRSVGKPIEYRVFAAM